MMIMCCSNFFFFSCHIIIILDRNHTIIWICPSVCSFTIYSVSFGPRVEQSVGCGRSAFNSSSVCTSESQGGNPIGKALVYVKPKSGLCTSNPELPQLFCALYCFTGEVPSHPSDLWFFKGNTPQQQNNENETLPVDKTIKMNISNTVLDLTGIPVTGNPSINCFFYRWSSIYICIKTCLHSG